MTDIIIKSFNRPHYLDRCIESIKRHVEGHYRIKVIDDGTPEKYLEKIKYRHPEVVIYKTKNYPAKIEAIKLNLETGKKINGFKIPIDDWKMMVKNTTEVFIMTEDDVWFTKKINIDFLSNLMVNKNSSLIKLGWISNRPTPAIVYERIKNIEFLNPNLWTAPPFIMDCFFDNKLKLFSLLYRLKIVDHNTKSNYWILNALLSGMFSKEYWLYIWHNLDNRVDESLQIKNASKWYAKNKHKNHYLYAKLDELVINTTFQSSATTSYHEHHGINFDVNQFNYYLNEAWFEDKLNVTEDLPRDIAVEKIITILNEKNNPNTSAENWKKWTEIFKAQYQKQQVNTN